MNSPEPFPIIRLVTADSLQADLAAGRVSVHPVIAEGLQEGIGGDIDFFVAESQAGEPRGQVGVNWVGATNPETRSALGLDEGETAPNIAFMEVPEDHRHRGYGRALLRAAGIEAVRRGHPAVFLSVAVGNIAAKGLYVSEGFVDTGLRREVPQLDRNPDGTWGEPVRKEVEFWVKRLGPS